MTVGCLVTGSGTGNAAVPDRGGLPQGEFYAPAGIAAESLPSEGIFPRGRRLAFMGYSGDPARDLTRGFTVAGPVYGDQSAYLQRCFEHHWPVVAHVGLRVTFNDKSSDKYRLDESGLRATIAEQVENLAPHPEIVWWAVTPEELRPWRGDEMRYLQIVADTVRETDPLKRPIYLYNPNHRDAATLTPIAKHVDILAKGCYVNLTGRKRDRTWVRWGIEQEVGALARAGRKDAIPLLMPELCQDPDPGEEGEIPQWVRHDIYLGLISGAKGVGIWSLFKRKEVRRTWQRWYDAYAACGRELNGKDGLAEVFLFGERRHDLAIHQASSASEARVPLGGDVEPGSTNEAERKPRTAAIPSWTSAEIAHRQSRYVFLVNSANEAASFTVAGWPAGSAADNPFDGKAVELPADGSLEINLPPYGVAAWRFSRAAPRIKAAPASTKTGKASPQQRLSPGEG